MLGSNSFPIGSNSSISKVFRISTSFFCVSTILRMKGSLESGYSLMASFLHRLMQSAASNSSLASLVTEYFLLSSTYLSFMTYGVLLSSDFNSLELLLLFFDVFDEFELFLSDLLSVLFQVLHLVGHIFKLSVVGFNLFLLLLNFFLCYSQALLGSKLN